MKPGINFKLDNGMHCFEVSFDSIYENSVYVEFCTSAEKETEERPYAEILTVIIAGIEDGVNKYKVTVWRDGVNPVSEEGLTIEIALIHALRTLSAYDSVVTEILVALDGSVSDDMRESVIDYHYVMEQIYSMLNYKKVRGLSEVDKNEIVDETKPPIDDKNDNKKLYRVLYQTDIDGCPIYESETFYAADDEKALELFDKSGANYNRIAAIYPSSSTGDLNHKEAITLTDDKFAYIVEAFEDDKENALMFTVKYKYFEFDKSGSFADINFRIKANEFLRKDGFIYWASTYIYTDNKFKCRLGTAISRDSDDTLRSAIEALANNIRSSDPSYTTVKEFFEKICDRPLFKQISKWIHELLEGGIKE